MLPRKDPRASTAGTATADEHAFLSLVPETQHDHGTNMPMSTETRNGAKAASFQQGNARIKRTDSPIPQRNGPLPKNGADNYKSASQNLTPWAKREASPQQDGQPDPVETGIADVMGQPRGQG